MESKTPYPERITKGLLIFDGAMGTMLYSHGVFLNRSFDEICLSNPGLVAEIHLCYIQSGAEAVETNSFGANPVKLAAFGLEDKVKEINKQAVRIARDAVGKDIYLAGSVGPLGVHIEPLDCPTIRETRFRQTGKAAGSPGRIEAGSRLTIEEAGEAFRRQMAALLEEDIDLILLETFKNIDELLLAVSVCRELSTEIPIQAQFTVGADGKNEEGTGAVVIADRLNSEETIDVIGVNCSVGPSDMLEILLSIKDRVDKPLAVMPNAGSPREFEGRLLYLTSPEYFAEYAKRFAEAGAVVIGGCCGTTPEHIKETVRALVTHDLGRRAGRVLQVIRDGVQPKDELAIEERSRLGNGLKKGEWITSVELVPPMTTSFGKVVEKADKLGRNGITCVNIPDGPRASSRISAMLTALEIERSAKIETILHYCCRDRNLIGMQSDLLGAYAAGLRNLLIVTGDPPKMGGYPEATGVFDVDSIGLISLVKRLNQGIDLGGSELSEPTAFVIGAGANPASLLIEQEVERTFIKREKGADFIITQPVFDVDLLLIFLEKIRPTGLPVLAGVWPLASYRNALFLNNEVPEVDVPEWIMKRMQKTSSKEDAEREGVLIAREIIKKIRKEVNGIQVSPPFGRIRLSLAVISDRND